MFGFHEACPTDAEVVLVHPLVWRTTTPVKVDGRVRSLDYRTQTDAGLFLKLLQRLFGGRTKVTVRTCVKTQSSV